jgi:hypothetical protein
MSDVPRLVRTRIRTTANFASDQSSRRDYQETNELTGWLIDGESQVAPGRGSHLAAGGGVTRGILALVVGYSFL